MKIQIALLIFALGIGCNGLTIAQDRPIPYAFSEKPRDCEINVIRIEGLRKLAAAESNRDSVVIAVARLGDGEYAQELNRRRLANLFTALTENLGMKKESVVIATGERVRGFGRVDVYVRGQLVDALLVNRGKDLCVDCCEIDPRYYPYRRNQKR